MKKKKFFLTYVGVLMAILFVSCHSHTVKIGAVLPVTGDLSGLGLSMRSGLELAIEELNSQSDDIKYELVRKKKTIGDHITKNIITFAN